MINVSYWFGNFSIPRSPYKQTDRQTDRLLKGERKGGGLISPLTWVYSPAQHMSTPLCLDIKQVIEEGTDKVMVEEESTGWVEH